MTTRRRCTRYLRARAHTHTHREREMNTHLLNRIWAWPFNDGDVRLGNFLLDNSLHRVGLWDINYFGDRVRDLDLFDDL